LEEGSREEGGEGFCRGGKQEGRKKKKWRENGRREGGKVSVQDAIPSKTPSVRSSGGTLKMWGGELKIGRRIIGYGEEYTLNPGKKN